MRSASAGPGLLFLDERARQPRRRREEEDDPEEGRLERRPVLRRAARRARSRNEISARAVAAKKRTASDRDPAPQLLARVLGADDPDPRRAGSCRAAGSRAELDPLLRARRSPARRSRPGRRRRAAAPVDEARTRSRGPRRRAPGTARRGATIAGSKSSGEGDAQPLRMPVEYSSTRRSAAASARPTSASRRRISASGSGLPGGLPEEPRGSRRRRALRRTRGRARPSRSPGAARRPRARGRPARRARGRRSGGAVPRGSSGASSCRFRYGR